MLPDRSAYCLAGFRNFSMPAVFALTEHQGVEFYVRSWQCTIKEFRQSSLRWTATSCAEVRCQLCV